MRRLLAMLMALGLTDPAWAQTAAWPTAVSRVERELSNPDPAVRRRAAKQLATLPVSAARQMLPLVLKDPDAEVRVAGGRAAIRTGIDARREAESWLSDPDPMVRQVAARMLGAAAPQGSAVTALARTLSDPVPAVRLEAAQALSNAPAEEGARVLLNHLDDAHEAFVLAVVDALATLRSQSAVVPLVGKISDPRVNVRRAVVRALGEFRDVSQVVLPLGLALSDSDPEVRRLAVDSAVAARAFGTMPALEERVRRDRDVDVQVAALAGLLILAGSTPDQATRASAAALAVQSLDDERQELRSEAQQALSERPHVARQELRTCLTAASGDLVGRCALALAHDHDAANADLFVAAWRQGRILAPDLLAALGVQGGDRALLTVLELLGSESAAVRTQAAEVIGDLLRARRGDGRAVEPVVEALGKSRSPAESEALLTLLGYTGSPRAVSHLLPFLGKANSAPLRLAAVRALGEIRGARVPEVVVRDLLTNEDSTLRAAATLAIREGEWPETSTLLLELLGAAKLDEVEGLAVALWGPITHVKDAALVATLERRITQADVRSRDALLEALARVDWRLSASAWRRLANERSCRRASKVAELLGAYPEAVSLLLPLTSHACNQVASNAVWALGQHGGETELPRVRELIHHQDPAVAGNAVAALARIAARAGKASDVAPALCEQVKQATLGANSATAANALFGLRHLGQRCGDGADERRLLTLAEAPQVRTQAAWLLQAVPATPDVDRKTLSRCVSHDTDGDVASACLSAPDSAQPAEGSTDNPTTILIVPPTRSEPEPGVPFTLLTEYGAYRFGWTDARGGAWLQTRDADAVAPSLPVGQW